MKNLTTQQSKRLPEWLTLREAARRKGVSSATVRNWVLAGRVRFVRERRAIPGHRGLFTVLLVSWPDVERIEPAYGPGRARRT